MLVYFIRICHRAYVIVDFCQGADSLSIIILFLYITNKTLLNLCCLNIIMTLTDFIFQVCHQLPWKSLMLVLVLDWVVCWCALICLLISYMMFSAKLSVPCRDNEILVIYSSRNFELYFNGIYSSDRFSILFKSFLNFHQNFLFQLKKRAFLIFFAYSWTVSDFLLHFTRFCNLSLWCFLLNGHLSTCGVGIFVGYMHTRVCICVYGKLHTFSQDYFFP